MNCIDCKRRKVCVSKKPRVYVCRNPKCAPKKKVYSSKSTFPSLKGK